MVEASAISCRPILDKMDSLISASPPRAPEMVTIEEKLKAGDVVLLIDSSAPRNSWIKGRILQSIPYASGTVCQVKLQTKNTTLERPVNKLCLLQEAVGRQEARMMKKCEVKGTDT